MDKELNILLVEDDSQVCCEFVAYIDMLDDIVLVDVTNNSSKAVKIVEDTLPDAVILDLELHDGVGNGLLFLQELKRLNLPKTPYILVTTNNSSKVTYDSARQLGADFIFSKHQADYSSQKAVDFLRMIRNVIQSRASQAAASEIVNAPAQQRKRLVRRICIELDRVGISSKVVGYQYLVDGIQIIMQGHTTNICALIGDKYGKTAVSVERAAQNAIARAWKTMPIDDLLLHYTARVSSEKGVPTLTEFLYYYANKLKLEY